MQDMQVRPLGLVDPLEREMAIQSSMLDWEVPWTGEPGELQSTGCRVGHNLATQQHTHICIHITESLCHTPETNTIL